AFERAAEREAKESAADVSRRMEMLTADLGRRIDSLFVAGTPPGGGGMHPDPRLMRERMAPMLGETAALVDRMEVQPLTDLDGASEVEVPPPPPMPGPPSGRRGGGRSGHRDAPHPPTPPATPGVIVMDVPALVQESLRAAASASAAGAASATGTSAAG